MIVAAFYAAPALLILALGVYTTFVRDTFPATVGFLAYGLLLTIAWVQLHGVDVALTEAAIGGGLTGLLLVRASSRLRATEASAHAQRPGIAVRALAAVMCAGVTLALAVAVLTLPEPAPTLAAEALASIATTGVGNPITAVLMAYRAMDTLLESIVLLLALIGVWSLAPDRAWGGRPGPRYNADPDGILAFIARVLPPIGIIVGIIFWVGADAPGGKFQGATIVAAMWLLVLMAGLTDAPPVSRRWVRALLVLGPLVFITVGIVGVLLAGAFLAYPDGWAKPLILVVEFALMPSLALTLALVMAGSPARAAEPPAVMSTFAMNAPTIFGLVASVLIGVGLYGLIVNPQPLRKILAFNVVGSGVFLLFGVIARRGADAGLGGDPVPQALLITGIVVAFSATALAVSVLLRLHEDTGSTTLESTPPASPASATVHAPPAAGRQ